MSRIVIDARELRTSTGRYIERLLHYLARTNSEHEYLVLLKPKDVEGWQAPADNFQKIACPYKEFTLSEQTGLLRQLNGLKADLVHFGMTQQPILYDTAPVVTTVHDLTTLRFTNPDKNPLVFSFKQKVYSQVIKRAARKSAAVITPTEFVKSDLVDYTSIDPAKVTVTLEAADAIQEPPAPLPDLQNQDFIMYVGRPTPHKNLGRLIDTFEQLQQKYPSLRLVLAGKKDANYQRIEAAAAERGINNIVFTGFVSEGELRWLYENCRAYVFPSLSEGFGLPGLEAMAHGAPVASSNATCLPEVYGDAARYFDPLNPASIAQAIDDLLTDQKLRDDLVKAGKQQVQKYSWQRMADQTLAVYESVLQKHS